MKSQPHPLHVALCCLAIATERLAWYATLAALVFLLPKTGMSVAEAVRYSGYLVSAAYACPLIGAQVADAVGYRLATLLGALSLTAGYGLLGLFPVPGLALVAVGNGLFKPSLMAMLTGAFLSGSPERNRACARLYRAINLGSLPSGFLAGFLVAGSIHRLLLLPLLPATAAIVVALGWRQLRGG
jgi:POT family proton-dependent oligopeptide transporter